MIKFWNSDIDLLKFRQILLNLSTFLNLRYYNILNILFTVVNIKNEKNSLIYNNMQSSIQ